MAVFSDSIETTFLTSVYVTRAALTQDSRGDYGTAVSTITSGLLGDVQPASRWLYHQTDRGADNQITHVGFFDVPGALPAIGDTLVDGAVDYAIRNVRNFKDHLELDMERLGV